jgi:hypothetical protein
MPVDLERARALSGEPAHDVAGDRVVSARQREEQPSVVPPGQVAEPSSSSHLTPPLAEVRELGAQLDVLVAERHGTAAHTG